MGNSGWYLFLSVFWRISSYIELSGIGGEFRSGRWHTARKGVPVVYLAEHPAVSLLEALVNLKIDTKEIFPETYQLLRIQSKTVIASESVSNESLATDWKDDLDATRKIGNDWLDRKETALLAVPSAPSPESTNYLLNPLHPHAANLQVEWARHIRYDRRLFQLSE